LGSLARAAVERGEPNQVIDELLALPFATEIVRTGLGLSLLFERACCRDARGDPAGAVTDLRLVGDAAEALGVSNPNVVPWRSRLALLIATERPGQATQLVAEELALARRAGIARAIGIAERAHGELHRGGQQLHSLRDSVSALESATAPLELARTLIALGRALRRQGQPKLARDPLRRALELVERAGAKPLAESARTEALAAGARPRRPWISGVEALTPSELRVALMAADKKTNRDIAQTLFVTPKTVGDHLANTYRKLDIHKRAELGRFLHQIKQP
jgi:DNA-binding CsgD family transcriptional regulator/exonuclease VII small subunit